MQVETTPLEGLLLIKPKVFGDARGYFFEGYEARRYREMGIACHFVQDNLSRSSKNVLRGLHFQRERAQDKLVTVTRGRVFDVAVDIRQGSPTFGAWYGVELSDDNHWQLFIPKGFAHGFYVLSEIADFHYKCSDYYEPKFETGLLWNDPDIGIEWPLEGTPLLSHKDEQFPAFKNIDGTQLPKFKSQV